MTSGTHSIGPGKLVTYDTGHSTLGRLIVAATNRGLCFATVGTNDRELEGRLRREYPKARIVKNAKVRRFLDGVRRQIGGQNVNLPLDLRGTHFQLKVWAALQRIPLGETRSYSEVAEMIEKPRAVRAVANACGTNPVPFVVPCHRVIRRDGSLGGYGLGLSRKRALLSKERTHAKKKSSG